jgi:uncharacterized protein (TIGR02611 family)
MRWLRRTSSIVAVSLSGTLLIIVGVVMLVTPGPGLLLIIAGLAVWSREFAWARRLRDLARRRIRERLGRDPTVRSIDVREAAADGDGDAPARRRVA